MSYPFKAVRTVEDGVKKVTISEQEYDDLKKESQKLAALEAAGVDNWEWYDDALSDLDDEESYEDIYGSD